MAFNEIRKRSFSLAKASGTRMCSCSKKYIIKDWTLIPRLRRMIYAVCVATPAAVKEFILYRRDVFEREHGD